MGLIEQTTDVSACNNLELDQEVLIFSNCSIIKDNSVSAVWVKNTTHLCQYVLAAVTFTLIPLVYAHKYAHLAFILKCQTERKCQQLSIL